MASQGDTFRDLERANQWHTAALVLIFVLVYAIPGLALDFIFHTFRWFHGLPVVACAAVLIACAQALRAYYRGSSVLIGAVGARELSPDSPKAQTVADVVDEMALAAKIPRPRLCLMDDPALNAFAAGRDPEHSIICVTQGLIDQLDREELQGVIAHEMAHIRGNDTRIMQMAVVMVGGFGLVSGSIVKTAAAQRRGDLPPIPGFGFVALPVFLTAGIGWLFSKAAAIALSRQREFLADAAAVKFTRNPAGLIRALERIARIESPLKAALRVVAPLFIVDPSECGGTAWADYLSEVTRLESQPDKTREQRDAEVAQYMAKTTPPNPLQSLFSTHPPIRDRIMRLRGLLAGASESARTSVSDLDAQGKAASETLAEQTRTNPDAMAAVAAAFLASNPAQQLIRTLTESASGETSSAESERDVPTFADAMQEAQYKKLYEYNLGLTGDKAHTRSEFPMKVTISRESSNIDPAQLRAALELGFASAHREPAPAAAAANPAAAFYKRLRSLSWVLIAASAGAIVAAVVVR